MGLSRRGLLKLGVLGAVARAGPARAAESPPPVGSLNELTYRLAVPEIFQPLPTAPAHSQALVIGTGFGAAVTALRLGQAGVQVTLLERGFRWPTGPWRQGFSSESLIDGRALWFRTSFTGFDGLTRPADSFGGVLDVTDYEHMKVWRGAAVGGGSVVFTGAMVQPEQRFFDHVFQGVVGYEEMDRVYYPLARRMLAVSPMPADVYQSPPFGHSRGCSWARAPSAPPSCSWRPAPPARCPTWTRASAPAGAPMGTRPSPARSPACEASTRAPRAPRASSTRAGCR